MKPAITIDVILERLASLRSKLPESLDKQLEKGGEDALTDEILARWLRGAGYDVEKAARRLVRHAAWRLKTVTDGRVMQEQVQQELAEPKQVFIQGFDKQYRPFAVFRAGLRDKATRDYKQLELLAVYSLDALGNAAREEPASYGKFTMLIDMAVVKFDKLDSKLRKVLFSVLEYHYPERLGLAMVVNAPLWMQTIWWLMTPWVKKETRRRFRFINDHSELLDIVDLQVLPCEYGGEAKLVPIEQFVNEQKSAGKLVVEHATAVPPAFLSL